jgi:hypothetical protein
MRKLTVEAFFPDERGEAWANIRLSGDRHEEDIAHHVDVMVTIRPGRWLYAIEQGGDRKTVEIYSMINYLSSQLHYMTCEDPECKTCQFRETVELAWGPESMGESL